MMNMADVRCPLLGTDDFCYPTGDVSGVRHTCKFKREQDDCERGVPSRVDGIDINVIPK